MRGKVEGVNGRVVFFRLSNTHTFITGRQCQGKFYRSLMLSIMVCFSRSPTICTRGIILSMWLIEIYGLQSQGVDVALGIMVGCFPTEGS